MPESRTIESAKPARWTRLTRDELELYEKLYTRWRKEGCVDAAGAQRMAVELDKRMELARPGPVRTEFAALAKRMREFAP